MSRVFMLGLSPLPLENQPVVSSLNRRTWHAARALQEDGHDLLLVSLRVRASYRDPDSLPSVVETSLHDNLLHRHVDEALFFADGELDEWCAEFRPDAIVGINNIAAYRACLLRTPAPIWADLNGYQIGEVQAADEMRGGDSHSIAWERERTVLQRADVFSTCSRRQRHAVIGELGAAGRLNRLTAGHELVWPILNAIEPEPYQHTRDVLRGTLVEPDDFVVLFSGGYNTWTDVDTLCDGLMRTMRRNRRIKFVSTGGAIKGHDERTFAHFRELIQASPFADRFLFVGWVETADVPNYYLESDVGVNVDKLNYEALLGARYRLTDMCKAGLPVVTTLGTEISQEIARAGVGLGFGIGDADGLAAAILRLVSDPAGRAKTGARAARYAFDNWVYSKVLEPLRAWARAPAHAPDFGHAAPAAPTGAGALFAPRSRLARLAWLVEREGYLGAGKRAASAVARRIAMPVSAIVRGLARLAARAFLERRPVGMARLATAQPRRVVVVPAADAGTVARAAEQLRAALRGTEIVILQRPGETAWKAARWRARVIGDDETPGVRAFFAQVRRLRAQKPEAVVVVGLAGRRAEVLARLGGARVYLIGDDGRIYASVIAPLKIARRVAARLLRVIEYVAYSTLLGLVIIGLGVADVVAAIVRATRIATGAQRRS